MPVTGNGHPGRRVQYAALPYRVRSDGEVQVRLITSRETRRWVIPKGWPIKGLSPAKTAAREAYEEAGLMGAIARDAVGIYTYEKNLGIRSVLCDVMVFPLKVKRHLQKWPERSQRYGFWFSIDTAAAAVQEEDLKGLILSFGEFMAVRLAAKREAEAAAAAKKKDVKPASKSADKSAAKRAPATALPTETGTDHAAPPAEGGSNRAATLSRKGAQRHSARQQPGVSGEPAAVSSMAGASKAAGGTAGKAEPRGMHPATPEEVGPDLSKPGTKSKKAQAKAKKAPSKAKKGPPVEAEPPVAARDASGVEPPDPVASTSSTARSGTTARAADPARKRPVTKPVPAAKAGAAPVAKAAVSRAVKSSPKPASRAAAQLAAGPAKTAVRADKGVKATLPLAGLRAEQESAPVPEGGLPVAKKLPKKVIAKGKRTSALAKAPRAEGPSQPSGRGRGGKR
ncbi:NUDIX hydrolase [Xanthobacter agilis]|uniref:8-oxo-dGTP pyrophosphatase MutT (NUDIX family) n=1 Tax=Xanthobacter agilis TaxID=47492 RepID=A0ABU0LHS1_XANAG|nr:NUDIX hydrolase [Xanthobacter agilis]MDQ0506642.1 8-oxo-dGTP pyrophosphatase MutT (NUDIX family) [Xanthobacter agilis]